MKNVEKQIILSSLWGHNFLTTEGTDKLCTLFELADDNLFGLLYVAFSFKSISLWKIIFKEENISAKLTIFNLVYGNKGKRNKGNAK